MKFPVADRGVSNWDNACFRYPIPDTPKITSFSGISIDFVYSYDLISV